MKRVSLGGVEYSVGIDPYSEDGVNVEEYVVDDISKVMAEEFDKLFLECMEERGFKFGSKREISKFIFERCNSVVYKDLTTYYVDGEPFLRFSRENATPIVVSTERGMTNITATLGQYTKIYKT